MGHNLCGCGWLLRCVAVWLWAVGGLRVPVQGPAVPMLGLAACTLFYQMDSCVLSTHSCTVHDTAALSMIHSTPPPPLTTFID